MSSSDVTSFPLSQVGNEPTDSSLDIERLLDLFPGAFYICDQEGRIVRYNQGAAELWGRRPRLRDPSERFCGAYRLYQPDGSFLPHAQNPMAETLRTGTPVRNAEVVIERPDGTRILALVNINPLFNAAGAITGAVNCFRDITEHRQQQERAYNDALRSHELLSLLPAAIYMTDAEGRITFYNEAAADLWGCRPELGKSEFCGSWKLFWPDGTPLPHDECPMAMALKEKRPIRGMDAVAERPDGTRVPFLPYPTPLFDASGHLIGAVNVLVDITERLHAEEAARRLALIVESSDDAIISTDLDGIVTSWNGGAERLYGYTAAEAIGQPVMILIPEDRPDEEPSILERIRRGERVDHYETVRRCKDGRLVDVSLTVSPIHDGAGRIIGASKIARDITDRRRGEEQQMLLLREMNHRIKNLFALAIGIVSLSGRAAGAEAVTDAIRERLGALARAHELTLHAFDDRARATTLRALIEAILEPYRDASAPGRFTLEGADLPIGGSTLTGVALLVHEFATNAAKYGALASPTGRIAIRWTFDGDRVTILWQEHDGPAIEHPPAQEGFGSSLARATVRQLGGALAREWSREGLVMRLSIPAERLRA
ncbi:MULTISPECIES: PAS domain S-box protein [unclassified Chelatococcus]|uniref:PAS domain S-box protein n=1 Tax=unclassified Chelatococcus TaxID=2638111 RepID=UPI0009E86F3D|nr:MULTISPECIES: PAS domain S-box protein [unclassified Chelatococcus]